MSEVKVLKLLDGLNQEELTEFDFVMDSLDKPRLQKLWDYVRKLEGNSEAYTKEDIYLATFGTDYTRENDYKLRNEIRLLRTELFDFLARKEVLDGLNSEPELYPKFLLKSLLRRELYSEFEFQFKSAYAQALERLDHVFCLELLTIFFYYGIRHKEMKQELVKELWDLSREAIRREQSAAQAQQSIIEQWQAVLTAISRMYSGAVPLEDAEIREDPDPRTRFMQAMSAGLLAGGEERLQHAQEAFRQIQKVEKHFPQNYVDALAACAGAHFALRNYVAARQDYEAAIEYAGARKCEFRLDIRFNYVSTLMKTGAYEEAIRHIEAHLDEIEAHPRVSFRFRCIHSFAYIFLEDEASARALVPANIRQRAKSEYQYFRFILCVLPYLRGDFEDGLRESNNFLHYFNRNDAPAPIAGEKEIANAFKHFYLALSDRRDDAWLREKLLSVKEKLQAFLVEHPGYQDYLYVRWLMERIGEFL